MARKVVGFAVDSPTARAELAPRAKGYFTLSAGSGKTMGYVRKPSGPGRWIVRERIAGKTTIRTLGTADDFIGHPPVHVKADGISTLTYAQAQRLFTDPDVIAKANAAGASMTVNAALDAYLDYLRASGEYGDEIEGVIELCMRKQLGHYPIAKLTKTILETWRDSLVCKTGDAEKRRSSQASTNRRLTILRAALNKAASDEANMIVATPWARLKNFKNVHRPRADHFDAAQVAAWCDAARELNGEWLANALRGGFVTGARYGEVRAMDVRDFTGAGLLVRAHDKGAGKTGERIITLDLTTRAWLRELVKGRSANAPLFTCATSADQRLPRHSLSRVLKPSLKQAGLPKSAVYYTLRHSYISRSIEAGVSLKVVAENCGTSLLQIEKTYAKVLAGARQQHIDKLGSVLHVVPNNVVELPRAA